jgi:hypothetical protein
MGVLPMDASGADGRALIGFYRGERPDDRGRTLDEIWTWTDDRLEHVHDYIQWLFPLSARSGANPFAPVLDAATIEAFHADASLRARLERSLGVMLRFYGLELEEGPGTARIGRSARFAARIDVWLWPGNHNHLRLTRIMTSLSELGLPGHARALRDTLERIAAEHPGRVTRQTQEFWRRAAG